MISLILQHYSGIVTKTPTLSKANYFQCKKLYPYFVVQHTLTKPILYKAASQFQFYYTCRTLCKEPRFRLNYLYTGHFCCKLYPILDQNCLISIPCPGVNCPKTIPFTAAHTVPIQLILMGVPPSPPESISPGSLSTPFPPPAGRGETDLTSLGSWR